MSHSHRDDHTLVDAGVNDAVPVIVTPPAPVVANSEAERRAAERRKAEGIAEQSTEHQFTSDLPEAERGGDGEIETRIRFGDDTDEDDERVAKPAAARRGPPPPRARLVEDESSWVAPPGLDTLGANHAAAEESWLAPTSGSQSATAANDSTWARERR